MKDFFPHHTEYLELQHTPGSNNATVRAHKKLDLEDIHGPLFYSVTCVKNGRYVMNQRRLYLKDINDNAPIFQQASYTTLISEAMETNSTIIIVEAVDKDVSPDCSLIKYSLMGTNSDFFQIRQWDGTITLRKALEYKKINRYILTVQATDLEGKHSTVPLIIDVQDYDNMNPHFNHILYMAKISENQKGQLTIAPEEIKAKDGDIGINMEVNYMISKVDPPTYSKIFTICSGTGVLSLIDEVDRENISLLTVEIKAFQQDNHYKTADAVVAVTIQDENDNAPEFEQSAYVVSIPENSPNGTIVHIVRAKDKDEGENAMVDYYLLPDLMFSHFFLIENPNEGKIITTGNLPRSGEILLTILAKDRGCPPLSSTAKLTVNVVDNQLLNQTEISISTTVSENTGAEHLVYTFAGSSGKHMTYKIVAGNEGGHFTLDENNGQLRTLKNLNYEERSFYIITVEAQESLSDISAGLLSENRVKLIIFVEDVNEMPSFVEPLYSTRILNSVSFKFPVIKVEATDPDSGEHGTLRYMLLDPPSNMFSVDEKTGQIFVLSVVGMTGTFSFKAQATDQEGRGLLAQVNVNVTVDSGSVNDAVVVAINQTISVVEQHIMEMKGMLKDMLQWTVYITDLVANTAEKQAKAEPEKVTFMKIVAIDENNQAVPAKEVRGKLKTQQNNIHKEFEKIFGRSVDISVEKSPSRTMSSEMLTIIVLSVLLCCLVVAFSTFFGVTFYRKANLLKQALSDYENQYVDNHGTEGSLSEKNEAEICSKVHLEAQGSIKDEKDPASEGMECTGTSSKVHLDTQGSLKDEEDPTSDGMECTGTSSKVHLDTQGSLKDEEDPTSDGMECTGTSSKVHLDTQGSLKDEEDPTSDGMECTGKKRVISFHNMENQSENMVLEERWAHPDFGTAMSIKANEPEVIEGAACMQEPIVEKPSCMQEENTSMSVTFPLIHT
uniref:Protocadherin Fat 3-like n=1 Tax=Geotrypetes seraphini TaxID=260995 RepID=A0A6P8R4E8_GEOSA|nr:protocadherin Fat 3-like [Geotrypetes seraphini]